MCRLRALGESPSPKSSLLVRFQEEGRKSPAAQQRYQSICSIKPRSRFSCTPFLPRAPQNVLPTEGTGRHRRETNLDTHCSGSGTTAGTSWRRGAPRHSSPCAQGPPGSKMPPGTALPALSCPSSSLGAAGAPPCSEPSPSWGTQTHLATAASSPGTE